MTDLNAEFIQVYEALKTVVNRLAGMDDSQVFQLELATNKSHRVRNRKDEISYIRKVRNGLIHSNQDTGQPTFVVTEAFVKFCREKLAEINKAVPAGQMGNHINDLTVANWDDPIRPLITTMTEQSFSHIPIVNAAGVVEGVFNESAIMAYLMSSGMAARIEPEQTLDEIRAHCRIGADHIETFRFISPLASEDQVADLFLTVTGPFTRVGAVFVTPGEAPDQPIQRMITAWDVLAQSKVK